MAYLTLSQFQDGIEQYRKLYDDGGTVDTLRQQADIDGATAVVDGYLAKRYTVPVTSATDADLLRRLTLALAREMAFEHKPTAAVPEAIEKAADRARATLKLLAAGNMVLIGATAAPVTGSSPAGSVDASSDVPVMDRTSLGGW